jgi:multisubunit Na+/H+ antiporter MnhG subunit
MRTLFIIGNVALCLATIPAILFVVFYSRSRWETTHVGRSTMLLSFAMALILVVTSAGVVWPHYPGRVIIRLVAFILIIPALWWRLISLVMTQREVLRYNRLPRSSQEGRDHD